MNIYNTQQAAREAAIQRGMAEGAKRSQDILGRTEKQTGADVSQFLGKQKSRAMGESAAFGAIDRAKSAEIADVAKQTAQQPMSGGMAMSRMVEAKRRASQKAAEAKNRLESLNMSDYGKALQGVYASQMNLPLAQAALRVGGVATPPTPEKRGILSPITDLLGV